MDARHDPAHIHSEDAPRSEKTVAELIAEDQADPTTPEHFDVGYEPLDLEDDDAR